ncbi:hypothetical protein D3C77_357580 [compost metagenome]
MLGIEQAGIDPRQARDAVLQGDVEQGRGRVGPGRDEDQFGRGLIEARPRERAPQRQAARAVGPPVEPGLRRRDGLFDRKSVELNPAGGAADQALPQAQLVVVLLEVGQRQAQRQLGRRPRLQLPHQAVAVDGVGVGLPVDQGAGRRGGEGRRRHGVGRHKAFLVAAAAAVVGAQQQAQAVAFAQGGGNEAVEAEIGAVVHRAAMASPRGAGGIRSSHGRAGDRMQAWAGQRRAQPQVQGAADDVAVDVGRARLDHLQRRHGGGGNALEVQLAVIALGRGQARAVEPAEGVVGVQAADRDVAALVLVEDGLDARQAAQAVGDVVVGLLADVVGQPVFPTLGGDGVDLLPAITVNGHRRDLDGRQVDGERRRRLTRGCGAAHHHRVAADVARGQSRALQQAAQGGVGGHAAAHRMGSPIRRVGLSGHDLNPGLPGEGDQGGPQRLGRDVEAMQGRRGRPARVLGRQRLGRQRWSGNDRRGRQNRCWRQNSHGARPRLHP